MMQPCALFRTFCEYFRLADTQAAAWRLALSNATWGEARSWAQEVQTFDLTPPHGHDKLQTVVPFFREVSPPARVIAVVESLVAEGLLSRADGSALEEKMLLCVDATGQWFLDV